MTARRSAARAADAPAAPAYVGAIAGALLIVSVFLPWYATNLGPPFSPVSASGWDATMFARLALGAGIVIAVASAALVIADRDMSRRAPRREAGLARLVVVAGIPAVLLVGARLIWMPDPAEFLSRQIGLYLSAAAALGATLAGLAMVATRD